MTGGLINEEDLEKLRDTKSLLEDHFDSRAICKKRDLLGECKVCSIYNIVDNLLLNYDPTYGKEYEAEIDANNK